MRATPANPETAGGRTVIASPGWMKLSRGMVVRAVIEARLLGRKLLTLDADIAILPAERDHASRPPPKLTGTPGAGLAEAARSLESGASELEAARRQMSSNGSR